MAIFPSSIPAYLGFTAGHTLLVDSHAAQHNQEQADIIAIAQKVGTGASTPTSGKFLRGNGSGSSAWTAIDMTADLTGILPVANGGTGSGTAADARTNLGLNTQLETLAAVYPVGCVYTETTGTNPSSTFGFGTWIAFGAGRVLVGNGTSDQAFAAGTTGGESTHLLSSAEMPAHTHPLDPKTAIGQQTSSGFNSGLGAGGAYNAVGLYNDTNPGPIYGTTATGSTGSGGTHNNLQPYLVVYFWKRTA